MNRRLPWLTASVFALTAATTAAMLAYPAIGTALQRNAILIGQGEVWRIFTTWLVETDGWQQMVVNFAGLAIFGGLVEILVGRFWWVIGYVGAGLAGEAAGYFWQPIGGGNSVAICGLIGLFSVWQFRRQQALGPQRFLGTVVWLGLGVWLCLHANLHGPALVVGFVIGALAFAKAPEREAKHG